MKIEIHTDGSCIGNPGPGGWGVVIHYEKKQIELSGPEKDTTNNRMEMMAMIQAMKWLHEKSGLAPDELQNAKIEVFSDSNLLIQTLNKGWKKNANKDLWAEIDKLRAWLNIKWTWVKAHADNEFNNLADELAQDQARSI